MKRAVRIQQIADYPFARWNRLIQAARNRGLDIIRLDVGDPDLPPPDNVVRALASAASQVDNHGYPGYRGLPVLREAMAGYYQRRFGVALDPDTQILPLIGSKEGIINLSLSCLDPGDLVLVPDPGYAPYAVGAAMAGAEVYRFSLNKAEGWRPDLKSIPAAIAEKATILWLNYPNNPTGAIADLDLLAEAVAFVTKFNILLCHDAPYCDVTYHGYTAPSVLQIPGVLATAVEFNSLSKSWNMAGWRVAMAVGNADVLVGLAHVKSNTDSGIYKPIQQAAVKALEMDPGWTETRNAVFQERMDIMVGELERVGMAVEYPRATLYLWAGIPEKWIKAGLPDSSERFSRAMLDETGIATAPGSFFGPGGEGYVRFSVTAPTDQIRQAMERLRRWLREDRPGKQ